MEKSLIDLLAKRTQEEENARLKGIVDTEIYSISETPTIRLKSMIGPNKIGIRPHARFAPFPRHNHDYVEVIYICRGTMTHHLNNQITLLLNEGSLLFLNKNVYHSIEMTSEMDVGTNIMISDDFITQLIPKLDKDSIVTKFLIDSIDKNYTEPEFLHYIVGDCIPIQSLLNNLVYSLSGDHHTNPSILPDNFSLLVNYLTLYDEALKNSSLFQDREDILKVYINSYIANNYRTATLEELANNTNYSVGYLCRYIKELFNTNFVNLLKSKRLEIAEDLLINTDMRIQDIVNYIGYENRYYFDKLFKEKNHQSPMQWRKQKKGEK